MATLQWDLSYNYLLHVKWCVGERKRTDEGLLVVYEKTRKRAANERGVLVIATSDSQVHVQVLRLRVRVTVCELLV